ncbi:MAG: hypothetical protein K5648_02680 [Erysipelotrichaceae bacterium]|nr:hypothetical protein [Erysipelotrichaceae bacterium]
MKVLFADTVLDEILFSGADSSDVKWLLNRCQEQKIEGYFCSSYAKDLVKKLDREELRKVLPILSKLLQPIHINLRDLREALRQQDADAGLIKVLVRRHRLDCGLVMRKNAGGDSTIELYVPSELRRKLENGKTS